LPENHLDLAFRPNLTELRAAENHPIPSSMGIDQPICSDAASQDGFSTLARSRWLTMEAAIPAKEDG
jgi:hypothetical protein